MRKRNFSIEIKALRVFIGKIAYAEVQTTNN